MTAQLAQDIPVNSFLTYEKSTLLVVRANLSLVKTRFKDGHAHIPMYTLVYSAVWAIQVIDPQYRVMQNTKKN